MAGLGMGAVLGLIFAPQSGKQTRRFLSKNAQKGADSTTAAVKKVRDRAENFAEQASEQVAEAIDAGKAAYREKKAGA